MNYQALTKTSLFSIALLVLVFTASIAKADDRTTEKTRDAVENASPDD